MRYCVLILLLLSPALAATEAERTWPLWDGKESVQSYAQRVNLPATKSIDLGSDVWLDLVLIPAGEFTMGADRPNIDAPENESVGILIGIVGIIVFFALIVNSRVRSQTRTQFSLGRFILMILALSVVAYGGVRWYRTRQAWDAYHLAMARFEHAYPEEKPAHIVTISKPFYMGKYEVTQAQYQLYGVAFEKFRGAKYPVGNLACSACISFCERAGHQIRLPTEAEWEYACRAGSDSDFGNGNSAENLDRVGWFAANSNATTHQVGLKEPNTFGLYDMHGNQYEWCADAYRTYPSTSQIDPCEKDDKNAPRGAPRVLRGGTAIDGPECCRATVRLGADINKSHPLWGFRVVMPVELPAAK